MKKDKIYVFEDGRWINENELEHIWTYNGAFNVTHYYKTKNGNMVSQRTGLVAGYEPKYRLVTDTEEIENVEKHVNPKPEDEL